MINDDLLVKLIEVNHKAYHIGREMSANTNKHYRLEVEIDLGIEEFIYKTLGLPEDTSNIVEEKGERVEGSFCRDHWYNLYFDVLNDPNANQEDFRELLFRLRKDTNEILKK